MIDNDVLTRLESAKWHLARYDSLQASLAGRAATLLSANALVLAAAAILVAQYTNRPQDTEQGSTLVALSAGAALLFTAASATLTARVLMALRPWRSRIGQGIPRTVFFMHSDTLSELRDYSAFATRFRTLSVGEEIEGATAALWILTKNYKVRVQSLRIGIYLYFLSMVSLAASALALLSRGRI